MARQEERSDWVRNVFTPYLGSLDIAIRTAGREGALGNQWAISKDGKFPLSFAPAPEAPGGNIPGRGQVPPLTLSLSSVLGDINVAWGTKADSYEFMSWLMLLEEAMGRVAIGRPLDKTQETVLTWRDKPEPPDWEEVATLLRAMAVTRPGQTDGPFSGVVADIAEVLVIGGIGAVTGGVGGALVAGGLTAATTAPTPLRDIIGGIRRFETNTFGQFNAELVDKLAAGKLPEGAKNTIAQFATPSTIALFTRVPQVRATGGLSKTGALNNLVSKIPKVGEMPIWSQRYLPITAEAAALKMGKVEKIGRWARNGAAIASTDIAIMVMAEGRNPTTKELAFAGALGAVGDPLAVHALPVIARIVGGTIRNIPGLGRVLELTADRLNRQSTAIRRGILELARLSKEDFDEFLTVPRLAKDTVTIGDDGYLLHGTGSADAVLDIRNHGLRVGAVRETTTDALSGAYLTTDFSTASTYAAGNARELNNNIGEVVAFRLGEGTRLIEIDGTAWKETVNTLRKVKKAGEPVSGQELTEALQKEGYGGAYKAGTSVTAGGKTFRQGDKYIVFDPADLTFVGRVVDEDAVRSAELATSILTQKDMKTVEEVLVGLDFEQIRRSFNRMLTGRTPLPEGTPKEIRALVDEFGERAPMAGGSDLAVVDSLNEAIASPQWLRAVDRIFSGLDADILERAGTHAVADQPLPSGMFSGLVRAVQSSPIFQPGLRKLTRIPFLASAFYRETSAEYVNTRSLVMLRVLKEAFGDASLKNPTGRIKGIEYVGPKPHAAHEPILGTMVDIMERPGLYKGLTPTMKEAAEFWTGLLNRDLALSKAAGVNIEAVTARTYLPHVVKEIGDDPKILEALVSAVLRRRGGRGISPFRPAHARRRQYETMADMVEVLDQFGYTVETDIGQLMLRRLMGGAEARANAIYFKSVLGKYGKEYKFGKRIPLDETRVDWDIDTVQSATKRQKFWTVPKDIAYEVSDFTRPVTGEAFADAAQTTIQTLRGVLLSTDLSFLSRQGYQLFASDPVRFITNFGELSTVMRNREAFLYYMAANAHRFSRFTEAGGTLYTSAIDLPGRRAIAVAGTKQPIDYMPIAGFLNERGFERMIPIAKLMSFEAMSDMLFALRDGTRLQTTFQKVPGVRRVATKIDQLIESIPVVSKFLKKWGGVAGKSDFEIDRIAADMSNNLGGGINWAVVGRQPGLISNTMWLTEGWTRANLGLIISAAKIGDPAGVLARRMLAQQVATAAVISSGVSMATTGQLPQFDPTETDFLDIQLEEGTVATFPMKTLLRTISRGILGVPWETENSEVEQRVKSTFGYLEGRQGQLPRLAIDLVTGKDFFGNPIDNKLLYIAQSLLPIVGGQAIESWREGVRGKDLALRIGIEAGGTSFIPRSPWEKRDREVSRAAGWRGKPFQDLEGGIITEYGFLNPDQKKEFDRRDASKNGSGYQTEIDAILQRRESPFTQFDEIDTWLRSRMELFGDAMTADQGIFGSRQLYRDRLNALKTLGRFWKSFLVQQEGLEFPEPSTLDQRIHNGYYEEVVEKSLNADVVGRLQGVDYNTELTDVLDSLLPDIDSDLFDELESSYFRMIDSKYGNEAVAKLKGWLGVGRDEDSTALAWRRDRDVLDVGFFAFRDSLFTPENLEEAGLDGADAQRFNTYSQYKNDAMEAMYADLISGPIPRKIAQYVLNAAEGTTVSTLFNVRPGEQVNEPQARQITVRIAAKEFKTFEDFQREKSNRYLQAVPEELCMLDYWEMRTYINNALVPYLALCGR